MFLGRRPAIDDLRERCEDLLAEFELEGMLVAAARMSRVLDTFDNC